MIRVICVELFFSVNRSEAIKIASGKVAVVPASEDNGESCAKWTPAFSLTASVDVKFVLAVKIQVFLESTSNRCLRTIRLSEGRGGPVRLVISHIDNANRRLR